MKNPPSRMPLIDALKGVAAQIILLHHLVSYGPLAEALREAAPRLADGLFEYGRMAVQVFLVIAGFLAARGLSPHGQAIDAFPLPALRQRYLRLCQPFIIAVTLTVLCAALARPWLDDDMIPAAASLGQWLAHGLLLHGVLGVESLSTGVWYVAIDFQLFALFALVLWSGRRAWIGPTLALLLGATSLFWFNRQAGLDDWGIYFFGAYMLGAAAWWASDRRRMLLWLGVIVCVGVAALTVEFRGRIAVALVISLLLGISRRSGLLERWPDLPALSFLGEVSYAVFLTHFAVLLLANAVYAQFPVDARPDIAATLLVILGVCLALGTAFHRYVEHPAAARRLQEGLTVLAGRLLTRPHHSSEKGR